MKQKRIQSKNKNINKDETGTNSIVRDPFEEENV
jgi:hypothetical protein